MKNTNEFKLFDSILGCRHAATYRNHFNWLKNLTKFPVCGILSWEILNEEETKKIKIWKVEAGSKKFWIPDFLTFIKLQEYGQRSRSENISENESRKSLGIQNSTLYQRQDKQKYLEEIETVAESDEVVSDLVCESDVEQNSYPALSRKTQRKKKEKEKEHLFREVMCSTETQSQYKALHEPGWVLLKPVGL